MTNADARQVTETARRLADDVLFPHANEVDRSGVIPEAQLDALADAGLYGLFSPVECGGLGLDRSTIESVQETLAGGCLTTAFVWTQHAGPARASAASNGPVRDRWASSLARGSARGGVAFAHLLRPGEPLISARANGDDWIFTGTAPFVTGWGHVDVVLTAARHGDDVVWAMVEAKESTTLSARRLLLTAVDSSVTVEVTFDGHRVPGEHVTHTEPFDTWLAGYHNGLRSNGSLALGVAARCVQLLGPSALDQQLADARMRLDTAPAAEMPFARAAAANLAVRAASTLVAATGGSAVLMDHHAQRLAREAMFLLVQGQTAQIKHHNLDLLSREPSPPTT